MAFSVFMWLAQTLSFLCAAVGTLLVTVIVKRLFFGALSQIPGPKLAAVSNIWYAYHVRNGNTATLAKWLHRRYGPVVRVGPNEVWFDSKEAYDIIYSTGVRGYEKSDFYLATALARPQVDQYLNVHFEDNLDLLSEMDMHRYRLQRRLIGRVYRTANAVRHEAAIDSVMDEAVAALESREGTQLDLKEWMHIIAVECLGTMVLSWSPGMLKSGTDRDTSNQSYLGWRRKSVFGLFPLITKLEVNHRWIGRVWGALWGVTYQTPKGFKPFFPDVSRKVGRRIKNKLNLAAGGQREDLLTDLVNLHNEKPAFTELYLRKMAVTNFGAGHETLASTLTAVIAMLGTHPAIQAAAREEIRQARTTKINNPHNNDEEKKKRKEKATRKKTKEKTKKYEAFTYAEALELEYTRAVIREAMRLHPVIGMSLPRVVPLHGPGLQLHGFYIPPGVTVGCNPVSLHRNEAICGPHPDVFDPRRWLLCAATGAGHAAEEDGQDGTGDAEARIRALERYSLNWGGGSRMCPGRHVAEMVVLKCVVRLLESFEMRVNMLPDEQVPTYFLAMLTGARGEFLPRQRV